MKKTKFRRLATMILSLVMLCTGFTLQSSANGTLQYAKAYEDRYVGGYPCQHIYNGYTIYEIAVESLFRRSGSSNAPIYTQLTEAELLAALSGLNSQYDEDYPNAYCIKPADIYYNAHYYAFLNQEDTLNPLWVSDGTAYMGPYKWQYEAYYDYRPRDIVCYYHDNGTPEYESDDVLIHTGIISGYSSVTQSNGQCGDIDLYMVDSKWGVGGVYRHNGYECPYTNYNTDNDGELRANKIRIFRLPNHEICDNTEDVTYEQHDSVLHQSICPCGQIIYEPHDIQRVIIDYGMNSIAPDAGTNAIVPPPLEDMICVDCGYRP